MDDTREEQSADRSTFEEDCVLEQRDSADENFNTLLDDARAFRRDFHDQSGPVRDRYRGKDT